MKERNNLEDLGADVKMKLELILKNRLGGCEQD